MLFSLQMPNPSTAATLSHEGRSYRGTMLNPCYVVPFDRLSCMARFLRRRLACYSQASPDMQAGTSPGDTATECMYTTQQQRLNHDTMQEMQKRLLIRSRYLRTLRHVDTGYTELL